MIPPSAASITAETHWGTAGNTIDLSARPDDPLA